jgi:peptide/nickel transport system substrate-binding protein
MARLTRREFLIASGSAVVGLSMPAVARAQTAAAAAGAPRRGGTLNVLINPEPPVLVSISRRRDRHSP